MIQYGGDKSRYISINKGDIAYAGQGVTTPRKPVLLWDKPGAAGSPRASVTKNQAAHDDFIYQEVRDKYGYNGNVSVPPSVILKLLLLLVFYNVRSERELMQTVPERLDWLWFLGYGLDSEIPDHSVLSKARKRWGVEVFRGFFEQIVWQCVEAGLVDGNKLFVDASLIEADASNNSVIDKQSLGRYLNKSYQELEKRLEDVVPEKAGEVNKRHISTTDPEASIVRCGGKSMLCYKVHRAVDPKAEIITAAEVTPGEVNEAHKLPSLLDMHQGNTGKQVEVAVADSKYGTIDNFMACHDRGVRAHIPDLKQAQDKREQRRGIFPADSFVYDEGIDAYRCPAGKLLWPKTLHKNRQSKDYAAKKKECAECELRQQCTSNKSGRTLKRHLRQAELDYMRAQARTSSAKRDIKTRQHLMERSFARGKPHGFDRARWRGLWRVQIQEYITVAIQNIQVLLRYGKHPSRGAAIAVMAVLKWADSRLRLLLADILKSSIEARPIAVDS
jgi:transposase